MDYIDTTKLIKGQRSEKQIHKNYPDLFEYLIHHYPYDLSWSERLWWYEHNINEYPLCPVCGNRLKFIDGYDGYRKYCSKSCKIISQTFLPECIRKHTPWKSKSEKELQDRVDQIKLTKLERYGDISYNNTEKRKLTNIEKYGVANCTQSEVVKDKIRKTKQERYSDCNYNNRKKYKQTNIERYGVDNYSKTDECREKVKQTMLDKYGVDNYSKTDEYKSAASMFMLQDSTKQCRYNLMKERNSFNTSSIERDFKQYLDEHNIVYNYQYMSDVYPFSCDFYFPDKDLYLEIQGSWTHGGHPFNPNDKKDLETLNKWRKKNTKYYTNAIYTWTDLDVRKRNIAKENNLNYIEIFSNNLNDIKNIVLV